MTDDDQAEADACAKALADAAVALMLELPASAFVDALARPRAERCMSCGSGNQRCQCDNDE